MTTFGNARALTRAQEQLERRRGEIARTAENSSRLAFAFAVFTSTGFGQFAFPKQVSFDVGFIERPKMSYGYYFDFDDNDEVVLWPRSTGFVWDFNQDAKGIYTGASCGVCVDTPVVISPAPSFSLQHYFTFAGVAMKSVPSYKLEL